MVDNRKRTRRFDLSSVNQNTTGQRSNWPAVAVATILGIFSGVPQGSDLGPGFFSYLDAKCFLSVVLLNFCCGPSSVSSLMLWSAERRQGPDPSAAQVLHRLLEGPSRSCAFDCDAIARYWTRCLMLIQSQPPLIRGLLSSARDWLAGAAGTDWRLPERRVQQRRRSEDPPASLQRPAVPTPANTAPLREYTPCRVLRSTV